MKIFIIVLAVIICIGFVLPGLVTGKPKFFTCQKSDCACSPGVVGESICETCEYSNIVFSVIIFSVAKECPIQRINMCTAESSTTHDDLHIVEDSCKYRLKFNLLNS